MTSPEISPSKLFTPGNIIEVGDLTSLVQLEDVIAREVNPNLDEYSWATRTHLRDLIRPEKIERSTFNGRISDITLQVMENPYDRLVDAPQRGWQFQRSKLSGLGGKNAEISNENAELLQSRYIGLELFADAVSTGRGTVGQIQAELWYYPFLPLVIKAGSIRNGFNVLANGEKSPYIYATLQDYSYDSRNDLLGHGLKRTVTKPRVELENFIKLNQASRRIGHEVLRDAMASAISTPFRN